MKNQSANGAEVVSLEVCFGAMDGDFSNKERGGKRVQNRRKLGQHANVMLDLSSASCRRLSGLWFRYRLEVIQRCVVYESAPEHAGLIEER